MTVSPLSPAAVPSAPGSGQANRPTLAEAADAFEAVFIRQVIASMRTTEFEQGSGSAGPFRDMFDARIADHIARSPGFTLSNTLVSALAPDAGGGQ